LLVVGAVVDTMQEVAVLGVIARHLVLQEQIPQNEQKLQLPHKLMELLLGLEEMVGFIHQVLDL